MRAAAKQLDASEAIGGGQRRQLGYCASDCGRALPCRALALGFEPHVAARVGTLAHYRALIVYPPVGLKCFAGNEPSRMRSKYPDESDASYDFAMSFFLFLHAGMIAFVVSDVGGPEG